MNEKKKISPFILRAQKDLPGIFAKIPEIKAAHIFGSMVIGRAGSSSDVDKE